MLVFVVTGAAGNTRYLNFPVGLELRWAVLAELCAVAIAYAGLRRRALTDAVLPASLAATLLVLAAASALWSPDVLLTLGRTGTLFLLLVTVGSLAWGTAAESRAIGQLLVGLIAGATAVALAGFVVLATRPQHGAVPANLQSPWRYNGLGENPNTVAMLLALALPPAAWALARAHGRVRQAGALATILLFTGSIVASGSRGALFGALVGTLPVALAAGTTWRRRGLYAGASVAIFLVSLGISQIPQPASHNPKNIAVEQQAAVKPQGAERTLPLEDEICVPRPGSPTYHRSLFSSGGRLCAWRGALGEVADRPLLGYGFGTEERVFVDRYYLFFSSRVENSYIGTLLQVGGLGLLVVLTLFGVVLVQAGRAIPRLTRPRLEVAAACAGTVLCGLILAFSQSFLTSVGSPATPAFWLALALLVAATSSRTGGRPAGA